MEIPQVISCRCFSSIYLLFFMVKFQDFNSLGELTRTIQNLLMSVGRRHPFRAYQLSKLNMQIKYAN